MWNSLSTRFWILRARTDLTSSCLYGLSETRKHALVGNGDVCAQPGKHCIIWAHTHASWRHWLQPKFSSLRRAATRTKGPLLPYSQLLPPTADPASKYSANPARAIPCAQHIQTARPCPTSTQFCRQVSRESSEAKSPQCLLAAWTQHARRSTQSAQSTTTSILPALSQDPVQAQSRALDRSTNDAFIHRTHTN